MVYPRNQLALILVDTNWTQAVEETHFCHLEQQPPQNLKVMRSFLGAVNKYWLMWPKRAHLLKPLSDKSGKKSFCWTPEMDQAFKIMKTILAADVLMAYPNHNVPFHIYTDTSDYQIGVIIIQQLLHIGTEN